MTQLPDNIDVLQALENPMLEDEQAKKQQIEEEKRKSLFEFAIAKTRLSALKNKWQGEISETDRRRLTRNVDVSTKSLRDSGKLRPDETLVPIRLIDSNIRREQPAFINFLKGGDRLAIFSCIDKPNMDCQRLEHDFTEGMKYIDWDIPHFKLVDGAQAHGWDMLEVVYDETKPLHVAVEHVGHDNFYFSTDAINLAPCEVLLRRYTWSAAQLKATEGFDSKQVDILLEKSRAAQSADTNVTVYKKMFKWQGVVYVAWYADECADWLKAPSKLYLGIKQKQKKIVYNTVITQKVDPVTGSVYNIPEQQPSMVEDWIDVDIKDYPTFMLPYSETEIQQLTQHKGRVYQDRYKQEAMTAIASGYVNMLTRSSNVYGSVEGEPGTTSAPRQLDGELSNGKLYDRKINFFSTPTPDPSTLTALQYFQTQNSEEVGQFAFAVNNRQDSRKTATENTIAQQQQTELSSVQVSLYSSFLRKVYSFCWLIVQSQALQNKIKFLQVEADSDKLDPSTGTFTKTYVNDMEMLSLKYNVKASGDVDVIQRGEMLNRMRQDWPVIQNTPLAIPFLCEIIRLSYPSMSAKWIKILEQGDPKLQVIQGLAQALQTLVRPETIQQLPPEQQQQLQQLAMQTQQVLNPQQQTQAQP